MKPRAALKLLYEVGSSKGLMLACGAIAFRQLKNANRENLGTRKNRFFQAV
jgi:hypothetical protein